MILNEEYKCIEEDVRLHIKCALKSNLCQRSKESENKTKYELFYWVVTFNSGTRSARYFNGLFMLPKYETGPRAKNFLTDLASC